MLLISHGSVLCGADRILEEHAARLGSSVYPIVEIGFLNYSAPSFEAAVARCHEHGATQIVIVPYFLVAGKFVTADLPIRIGAARKQFPELQFTVADALLDAPELATAVLEMADRAVLLPQAIRAARVPGSECQLRPDCPLFNSMACPRSSAR
ncbi:MAG: sirohydrochlorin chelatase [Candidatus Sumerlaeaceae bacterium]